MSKKTSSTAQPLMLSPKLTPVIGGPSLLARELDPSMYAGLNASAATA